MILLGSGLRRENRKGETLSISDWYDVDGDTTAGCGREAVSTKLAGFRWWFLPLKDYLQGTRAFLVPKGSRRTVQAAASLHPKPGHPWEGGRRWEFWTREGKCCHLHARESSKTPRKIPAFGFVISTGCGEVTSQPQHCFSVGAAV